MKTNFKIILKMKKDLMNFEHRWKLLDWIDENKLKWFGLSQNPNAMFLIENNIKNNDIGLLYLNPSAYYLLKKDFFIEDEYGLGFYLNFLDKYNIQIQNRRSNNEISYSQLAIPFFEKKPDRCLYWFILSSNPAAIHLLENNFEKIDWNMLSENPAAIHLLEKNSEKICWINLSKNPAAIHLLEKNPEKIDWNWLSKNPSAIHLLENNMNKINWNLLSLNPAKGAIRLLEKNKHKIDWISMSRNPGIFELDYDFFYRRMNIIRKELMEKMWHPNRFREWCLDIDELKELC